MKREKYVTRDDCFVTNQQSMFCVTEKDSVQSILRRSLVPFVDKTLSDMIIKSTERVFFTPNRYTTVFLFTDQSFQFFEVIASKENSGKYRWMLSNVLFTNDCDIIDDKDVPSIEESGVYKKQNVYCIRQMHLFENDNVEDIVIYIPQAYFL